MTEKIILIGGFNELIELSERCGKEIIGIIDNEKTGIYMGYKILGNDDCAKEFSKNIKIFGF